VDGGKGSGVEGVGVASSTLEDWDELVSMVELLSSTSVPSMLPGACTWVSGGDQSSGQRSFISKQSERNVIAFSTFAFFCEGERYCNFAVNHRTWLNQNLQLTCTELCSFLI